MRSGEWEELEISNWRMRNAMSKHKGNGNSSFSLCVSRSFSGLSFVESRISNGLAWAFLVRLLCSPRRVSKTVSVIAKHRQHLLSCVVHLQVTRGQHPSCRSATVVADESKAYWVGWVSVNFIVYFCCHLELVTIERILRKGTPQRQPVETAVVSF